MEPADVDVGAPGSNKARRHAGANSRNQPFEFGAFDDARCDRWREHPATRRG